MAFRPKLYDSPGLIVLLQYFGEVGLGRTDHTDATTDKH